MIEGDGSGPVLVELKSYRVGDKYVKSKPKRLSVASGAYTAKTPLWRADKGSKGRTTMHRQILLDAIATRDQLSDNSDEGNLPRDFVWYFQNWKRQIDDGELNTSVGVSLADLMVTRRNKEFTGIDFLARRLSPLAPTKSRKESIERIAFNLGLPKAGSDEKLALYLDTGSDEALLDGGLKRRIKAFGLFGDISVDSRNRLIREVFGFNPESDFVQLMLGEEIEWIEGVQTHVDNLEEKLDELADTVIDDEFFQKYEEQFDEFEQDIASVREDLINSAAESLPKTPENEQSCQ